MRRTLLASVASTALAIASALAANVPPTRYTPPRAPTQVPFFSWSGFYLGVNGGYGLGRSNWTDTVTAVSSGGFDLSDAVIGGTAGYNRQMGSAVFGIETDFDWSNIKGSTAAGCPAANCETANDWLGTLRARLGFALDRFMPYLTGGMAYGQVKGAVAGTGSVSSSSSNMG